MKDTLPHRVRFGAFELDLKAGELRLAAEPEGESRIVLTDQPFRLLVMLVEREGETVTREEIQKKFWPNDTIVEFDHSINVAIGKLRKALGDSADEPHYIETLARRGYRLIVPVEWMEQLPVVSGQLSAPTRDTQSQADAAPLIGRTVSHYRVLEVIGGGGMGMVYKAEDLKLGRRVAVKFLPEELASDAVALQRFEREAQTASSLNHPNICTIYEIEEHEGQPFIVMELLEGETLRDRLASSAAKAVPLDQLLNIATQICDGLQAAHERRIIHRDIKPANIFLTASGQVKILDFGLAKLVVGTPAGVEVEAPDFSPANGGEEGTGLQPRPAKGHGFSRADRAPLPAPVESNNALNGTPEGVPFQTPSPADASLTHTGLAMGTAGYMSPEQVRGEKLDARTDIFSFGLVLYEMATGQRAFSGETAAVVQDAILNQTPILLQDRNSSLPAKLITTIGKALEKDLGRRYQSAAEMRAHLETVSNSPGQVRHEVSARGRWAWPVAAALALTLTAAAGWWWSWGWRHSLKLTDNDTIVLANFVNNTGDPVFDVALTGALSEDLEQTPFLNVLVADKVRATLKSLNRPENAKLTPDLAREVCARSNSRAFVVGSIADVGNEYQIALRATDCRASNRGVTMETQAENRAQIIKVLGLADAQLRGKLGEPQASLRKFNQPLELAMSSSPEALQAFKLGEWNRDPAEAIAYLKRAVTLDPNFARAYASLGNQLSDHSLRIENLSKAYQLRGRASQRWRNYIEGHYYYELGETDEAAEVYRRWIQTYPNDFAPHDNLSSDLLDLGELEAASAEAQEARRLLPGDRYTCMKVMETDIALGEIEDAKKVFEEDSKRGEPGGPCRLERYYVAFLEHDNAGMQEQVAWATGRAWDEANFIEMAAETEGYYGHLAKAAETSRKAFEAATRYRTGDGPGMYIALESLRQAEVGDLSHARRTAAAVLKLQVGGEGVLFAALSLAITGDTEDAQRLADKLNREFPLDTLVQKYSLPTIRAAIAEQKGLPNNAVGYLNIVLPYDRALLFGLPSFCPVYLRGVAYLQLGSGQQAAAEFQKILDHPGLALNFVTGALAHLQLGRAQTMIGDKAAARKSYGDFLTLWKVADPGIPIYQQAKAEYARLR